MRRVFGIALVISGILIFGAGILTGIGPIIGDWSLVTATSLAPVQLSGMRCQIDDHVLNATVNLRNSETFAQEFSVDYELSTDYGQASFSERRGLCVHTATVAPGESTTITCEADLQDDTLPQIVIAQIYTRNADSADEARNVVPHSVHFCRVPTMTTGSTVGLMLTTAIAASIFIVGGVWLQRQSSSAILEERDE